jgi:hypothetical protein
VNTESDERQPEQPSGPPGGTGPVDPTKDPDWLDEKKPGPDDDTPETAEPPEAEELPRRFRRRPAGKATRRSAPPTSIPTRPGPTGPDSFGANAPRKAAPGPTG